MNATLGHDPCRFKCYDAAMIVRILTVFMLLGLSACGGCEGRVSNTAGSAGRCQVLTVPW